MASVQLSISAEKTTARKVSISLPCLPHTILSFINKKYSTLNTIVAQ